MVSFILTLLDFAALSCLWAFLVCREKIINVLWKQMVRWLRPFIEDECILYASHSLVLNSGCASISSGEFLNNDGWVMSYPRPVVLKFGCTLESSGAVFKATDAWHLFPKFLI